MEREEEEKDHVDTTKRTICGNGLNIAKVSNLEYYRSHLSDTVSEIEDLSRE